MQIRISNENLAPKLRCAISVRYRSDFEDLAQTLRYFIDNFCVDYMLK